MLRHRPKYRVPTLAARTFYRAKDQRIPFGNDFDLTLNSSLLDLTAA